MLSAARLFLLLALASAMPQAAWAQDSRVHLTPKGGVTVERSEDALTGTAPALGLAVAAALTPAWRAEFEFWRPNYLQDGRGEPKHRRLPLGRRQRVLCRPSSRWPLRPGA